MKKLTALLLCCIVWATPMLAAEQLSEAQKAFEAGNTAYDQHQYQNAIYAFQHAIQYDPEYYEAYCMLGLMYLLNDEVARGLNMLTYASQAFPKNGYALALLGDYYQTQKQTEKAIEYYQKAIDLKMPRAEKQTYTNRLKNIKDAKKEILNLKTTAANNIIKTVSFDKSEDWSVAYGVNEPSFFEITYQYKKEDLLKDDWTQKITLKCTRNKIGQKPFKEIFNELTQEYIARGIGVSNMDPSFRSGSFTTTFGESRSVVYVFAHERNLCTATHEKQERWGLNEPSAWLKQLKTFRISGDPS